MTKKNYLLLLYFIFFCTYAQTYNLKSISDNSNSKTDSYSHSSNNRNNASGCANNAFLILQLAQFSYQGIVSLVSYQKSMIAARIVTNPRIKSLDIIANIGAPIGYKSIIAIPELRANLGLISSDLRYNYLHEFGVGNYGNLDWQIVMFNLISKYNTYFRIGAGFTRDMYLKETFTEFGLQTDFKVAPKIFGILQGRYAPNFASPLVYRSEIQAQIAYKIKERSKGYTQITAGYIYQNYWQSVQFHTVSVGIVLAVW